MDIIYLGIAAVCVGISVWFIRFCQQLLMEDKP